MPGLALAQSSPEEEDGTQTLDTVQVTGSRLKRAEIEGAAPVTVITRAQIDMSGDVSVADVLRDSTFASFGNFRPQSGSTAQSLATIDLRGVGSGRTLVLIDGRRAPTNPMAAGAGALRLQLGGGAWYHGAWEERPPLGAGEAPVAADIERALKLLDRALLLWILVLLVVTAWPR